MEGSASRIGSKDINPPISESRFSSKLKTYGFAIAIIVGIGGLAVGAAGLSGYFHVGTLSNMAQVDAIIMMAAGSGSGTVLLIIGLIGTVKALQSSSHQRRSDRKEETSSGSISSLTHKEKNNSMESVLPFLPPSIISSVSDRLDVRNLREAEIKVAMKTADFAKQELILHDLLLAGFKKETREKRGMLMLAAQLYLKASPRAQADFLLHLPKAPNVISAAFYQAIKANSMLHRMPGCAVGFSLEELALEEQLVEDLKVYS